MTQRLLGDIQHAVVALQEAALQAEADRRRRLDPTLRLKDYRLRRIQAFHGTLTIRVPHGSYWQRGPGAGATARTGAPDRYRDRARPPAPHCWNSPRYYRHSGQETPRGNTAPCDG